MAFCAFASALPPNSSPKNFTTPFASDVPVISSEVSLPSASLTFKYLPFLASASVFASLNIAPETPTFCPLSETYLNTCIPPVWTSGVSDIFVTTPLPLLNNNFEVFGTEVSKAFIIPVAGSLANVVFNVISIVEFSGRFLPDVKLSSINVIVTNFVPDSYFTL